jgi:hypothetical protein
MAGWNNVHNRLEPEGGPQYYKTYRWAAPLETHWRRAHCEEVDCIDFLKGFIMTIDLTTNLGLKQAHYLIKEDKDRHGTVQRTAMYQIKIHYPPGTPCMKRGEHRAPIGRPPLFVVSGGDWRGNPRGTPTRRFNRAEDWIDEFANHQIGVAEKVKRG